MALTPSRRSKSLAQFAREGVLGPKKDRFLDDEEDFESMLADFDSDLFNNSPPRKRKRRRKG